MLSPRTIVWGDRKQNSAVFFSRQVRKGILIAEGNTYHGQEDTEPEAESNAGVSRGTTVATRWGQIASAGEERVVGGGTSSGQAARRAQVAIHGLSVFT